MLYLQQACEVVSPNFRAHEETQTLRNVLMLTLQPCGCDVAYYGLDFYLGDANCTVGSFA